MGEIDTTTNPLLGFYSSLSALLKDEEWTSGFAAKLKSGTLEPLDFAVMCQADESIVRHLFDLDPNQLKTSTVAIACNYGAKPGVIPFMAKAKPEVFSEEVCPYEYTISLLMSHGPGPGHASEDDIKSMVEVFPGSVAKTMFWHEEDGPGKWTTPLQQCIALGYSDDLRKFMCNHLPATIDNFEISDDYGHCTNIDWIAAILPKVNGKLDICALNWEGDALRSFLEYLFLNTTMKALDLQLPRCCRPGCIPKEDDEVVAKTFYDLPSTTTLADCGSFPRIEELSLSFDGDPAESSTTYLDLLDSLIHWPCLISLKVEHCGNLDLAVPAISSLLKEGKLKQLSITTSAPKRKVSPLSLQPILEALRRNTTLERLEVRGMDEEEARAHAAILLDVLKDNSTLQEARGFPVSRSDNREGRDELTYHLYLNQCGRALARDPKTSLVDFVSALSTIEDKLSCGRQYIRNVQYALLLEAVGVWVRA